MRLLRTLASAIVLFLIACDSRGGVNDDTLSTSHREALEDSIAVLARDSEAAWAAVNCQDLSPVLRYWGNEAHGIVHASENVMRHFSDQEWEANIRSNVCRSGSGPSTVDSLLVAILSADVATATMRYHADVKDSTGRIRRHHGQILRVWQRAATGWRIRSSMSTHLPDDPSGS